MSHWKSGILATVALSLPVLLLGACEKSKTEKAEIVLCQKVAKSALHDPASFKVTKSTLNETSEGAEVLLEVDYSKDGQTAHVFDRCWFGGYAEKKPLKTFSYRETADADYEKLSDEDLKNILGEVSG